VQPERADLRLGRPRVQQPGRPRLPRGLRSGGFLPGWSSVLGGIGEFPEFREISRSSRAIFSAS
jgi:hypothetical protein